MATAHPFGPIDEIATAALRSAQAGEEWEDIVCLTSGDVMLRSEYNAAAPNSTNDTKVTESGQTEWVTVTRGGRPETQIPDPIGPPVLTKAQRKNLRRAEKRRQEREKSALPNSTDEETGEAVELATKGAGRETNVDVVERQLDVNSVGVDPIHQFSWDAWEKLSDDAETEDVQAAEWQAIPVKAPSSPHEDSQAPLTRTQRKNIKRAEKKQRMRESEAQQPPVLKTSPNPALPAFDWDPRVDKTVEQEEWTTVKANSSRTMKYGSHPSDDRLLHDLEAEQARLKTQPLTKAQRKNLARSERRRRQRLGLEPPSPQQEEIQQTPHSPPIATTTPVTHVDSEEEREAERMAYTLAEEYARTLPSRKKKLNQRKNVDTIGVFVEESPFAPLVEEAEKTETRKKKRNRKKGHHHEPQAESKPEVTLDESLSECPLCSEIVYRHLLPKHCYDELRRREEEEKEEKERERVKQEDIADEIVQQQFALEPEFLPEQDVDDGTFVDDTRNMRRREVEEREKEERRKRREELDRLTALIEEEEMKRAKRLEEEAEKKRKEEERKRKEEEEKVRREEEERKRREEEERRKREEERRRREEERRKREEERREEEREKRRREGEERERRRAEEEERNKRQEFLAEQLRLRRIAEAEEEKKRRIKEAERIRHGPFVDPAVVSMGQMRLIDPPPGIASDADKVVKPPPGFKKVVVPPPGFSGPQQIERGGWRGGLRK